ncbi:hypothetical protein H9L39_17128 [Fusarium oxysporum f. sp. albedinis]|nr:hypothetical protein H9L39_17128 [Fusarium oxysporum f. sp. albedinis]
MAGLPLRLAGRTDVVPQNNGFTVPALDDSGMSTASGLEQTSYGLDLVHMQYISIGTLTIAGVRFSILMFFPTGEIPSSYDLLYAKSHAYQEKAGAGHWGAEEESRTFRLSYNIPASNLPGFWA